MWISADMWEIMHQLFPTMIISAVGHIMSAMASQITGVSIVYSTACSGADQRKHQSSTSLAFVKGIHRWPVIYPHKEPVTRKMFPFHDVIMNTAAILWARFIPISNISLLQQPAILWSANPKIVWTRILITVKSLI